MPATARPLSRPRLSAATAVRPRRRRNLLVALGIGMVSLLATACASLPPARPIATMEDIAGTWEGMADLGRRFFLWRTIIAHDGKIRVEYADVTLWGTVTLGERGATYDLGTATGRLTLYGGGHQRVLEMVDNWGGLYVQMKPL